MSSIVRNFTINARYDLQAPFVRIFYETASHVNGSESLSLSTDFYPNPVPTSPQQQFAPLEFTVDLQGLQASLTTAKLFVEPMLPTDPNWWLQKHPQHRPQDLVNPADASTIVASFAIDPNSLQRSPNPQRDNNNQPVADLGLTSELTTGQLTDWMTFKAQRITFTVLATITMRDGTIKNNVKLNYQCLSTNASSGTYTNQTITAAAEPVPVDLAQAIYNAISVLQFEGELTLQEEDVSGSLSISQVFNFINGANSEWTGMNALVQSVTEDIDSGQTTVSFGPPRFLSAGELVDLLRVNRARLIRSIFSMRPAGTASGTGGQVDLGQNTPEKNSVSGEDKMNPHVISAAIDGSGSSIIHKSEPDGSDCSTQWALRPGVLAGLAGSATIRLGDCGGEDVKIQQLSICLNGVPGKMRIMCGPFTPDS